MKFKQIYCVIKITEYQHYHRTQAGQNEFKRLSADFQQQIWESHQNQIKFFTRFMELTRDLKLKIIVLNEDAIGKITDEKNILILSCGGDGTFLTCAQKFPKALLIGMNPDLRVGGGGSMGALALINSYNLEAALTKLAKNEGVINLWNRLSASVNGKNLAAYAVNDIFVGNPISYLTCNISVEIGGIKDDFNCSGFLACTGMGSSAWFEAAGGSRFSNELSAFGYLVLVPSQKWQPKFVSGVSSADDHITIIAHRDGYVISFDSKKDVTTLKAGDRVKIFIDKQNSVRVLNLNLERKKKLTPK